MGLRVLGLLLLVACSTKKDAPKPPPETPAATATTEPAAAAPDNTPRGLCTRGCTKLLGCAGSTADQMAPCVANCTAGTPQQAQIEQIEALTCEQIATMAAGGAAPTGGGGCTADCRGCVGDNSSCYAVAGGANGIPCDPCCCAAGGPSPVWRTE
jgi:hypothetical protein